MDDELRRRAADSIARMRSDATSDWPSRLLSDISNQPLGDPEKLPHRVGWAKPGVGLTPQEVRVLQAAAAGLTNQMTADMMVLSVNTVMTHRQACIYKLRAKNISHAIALAMRQGVIS